MSHPLNKLIPLSSVRSAAVVVLNRLQVQLFISAVTEGYPDVIIITPGTMNLPVGAPLGEVMGRTVAQITSVRMRRVESCVSNGTPPQVWFAGFEWLESTESVAYVVKACNVTLNIACRFAYNKGHLFGGTPRSFTEMVPQLIELDQFQLFVAVEDTVDLDIYTLFAGSQFKEPSRLVIERPVKVDCTTFTSEV